MTGDRKPTILTFAIVGIIVLLTLIVNYPLESFFALCVVLGIVLVYMKWGKSKW